MLREHLFIAVDGGASKSMIRIETAEKKILGEVISGPANIRLSVEQAWSSISLAIEKILKEHQLTLNDAHYHFHMALGLAGCEIKKAREDFLKKTKLFSTLHLFSDAHTALVGAHGCENGAIIIVGTGAHGYCLLNNKVIKVSGWGFPHDDQGSGAWLGFKAAQLTLQWLDGRCAGSNLTEAIMAYFQQQEDFIVWVNEANATAYATLAPIVIAKSREQDPLALLLMRKSALAIEAIGKAISNKTKHSSFVLTGGIAPFLFPYFSEQFQNQIHTAKGSALDGAMFLLRQNIKIVEHP